jgi:hypothetical protein
MIDFIKRFVFAFLFALAAATVVHAQWLHVETRGVPRTADGKPNLLAPAPRTSDGKPDLSGIWRRMREDPKVMMDLAYGNPDVLLQPAAEALYAKRLANGGAGRPSERCLPDSVPDGFLVGPPIKIIQTPDVMVVLYEQMNHYRQLFTDGRKFPEVNELTWLGYSIAKWEGDTLVAETVGLNEQTWLDVNGPPTATHYV